MRIGLLLFIVTLLLSCAPTQDQFDVSLEVLPLETEESLASNLYVSPAGVVYLTWIEVIQDTTYSFRFSRLEGQHWSTPIEIATGSDWFVNWADIPSLTSHDDQHLIAHWLQMSADGTYDYDVTIVQSMDAGISWSPPMIPHRDGIAAEHGFVTMQAIDAQTTRTVWLDGRNTKADLNQGHDHGHGGGNMTLRSAIFDQDGNLSDEYELDNKVCDCCQTDMLLSESGPVIAYRDRSNSEIRDISVIRKVNDTWSEPIRAHNDAWSIHGCPVNGPALAQNIATIALAWFTGANDTSRVQLVLSEDGGKNFGTPITIDDGNPLGRVDVVAFDNDFYITWIEQVGTSAEIRIKRYSNSQLSNYKTLVEVSSARSSGFPILEVAGRKLVLTWTGMVDGRMVVESGVVGL